MCVRSVRPVADQVSHFSRSYVALGPARRRGNDIVLTRLHRLKQHGDLWRLSEDLPPPRERTLNAVKLISKRLHSAPQDHAVPIGKVTALDDLHDRPRTFTPDQARRIAAK
jgi:hypothetical protein